MSLTGIGSRAISSSDDQTLHLWDVATGRCQKSLHMVPSKTVGPDPHQTVIATSDGHHFVCRSANEPTVEIRTLGTGQPIGVLWGHQGPMATPSVACDGLRLVCGSWEYALQVWHLSDGKCHAILMGHTDIIAAVELAPDGRRAVTGSWDHTLRVWDLVDHQCLATLQGHADTILALKMAADGCRVASLSKDQTVRIWELATGECIAIHLADSKEADQTMGGIKVLEANGSYLIWRDLASKEMHASFSLRGCYRAYCAPDSGSAIAFNSQLEALLFNLRRRGVEGSSS